MLEYRSDDWDSYRMDYHNPHRAVEALEREVAVVGEALDVLKDAGILPHTEYVDMVVGATWCGSGTSSSWELH